MNESDELTARETFIRVNLGWIGGLEGPRLRAAVDAIERRAFVEWDDLCNDSCKGLYFCSKKKGHQSRHETDGLCWERMTPEALEALAARERERAVEFLLRVKRAVEIARRVVHVAILSALGAVTVVCAFGLDRADYKVVFWMLVAAALVFVKGEVTRLRRLTSERRQ